MLRKISYFFITIVVIFLIVIFFSEKITKYECIGKFQNTNKETSIFLKHSEYRWWVSLWSKSSGTMWVETPGKNLDVSTDLNSGENQIFIFDYKKELKGIFSPLSKHISIKLTDHFYDGSCKEIK
jgi:hypothetical protein